MQNNKEEIYRIVDSFLVEAKDQDGRDRSIKQLNADRHLAVEAILAWHNKEMLKVLEEVHTSITDGAIAGKEDPDTLKGAMLFTRILNGLKEIKTRIEQEEIK